MEPLPNVTLILVYPKISTFYESAADHAHENMFNNLLPKVAECVEKIDLSTSVSADPKTMTRVCLALIRERIEDLAKRRPDDHIFLAGWGISSLLNVQALQKAPGVTGILNFAFPLRSHLGFRGTVDDTICLTYCPSLFIVGESATNVNLEKMQAMRDNMIRFNALIRVAGGDDNLKVCPTILNENNTNQQMVEEGILGQVVEFMLEAINEEGLSAEERRPLLKPVEIQTPFDVDPTVLKGRASGAARPKNQ